VKIFRDIDGYWIFIDIVTLWFKGQFPEPRCPCNFQLLFSFVPFCGSEYCGSVEVFFILCSKG
jgi:hypothetical protein